MANRIKELRKARRLSQTELAELVGVSNVSVSNWERGLTIPSVELAKITANVLGVDVSYLLGDDIVEQNIQDEIHAHRRGDGPVDDSDVNLAKSLELIIKQYEAGYLTQDEFNQAKRLILGGR